MNKILRDILLFVCALLIVDLIRRLGGSTLELAVLGIVILILFSPRFTE